MGHDGDAPLAAARSIAPTTRLAERVLSPSLMTEGYRDAGGPPLPTRSRAKTLTVTNRFFWIGVAMTVACLLAGLEGLHSRRGVLLRCTHSRASDDTPCVISQTSVFGSNDIRFDGRTGALAVEEGSDGTALLRAGDWHSGDTDGAAARVTVASFEQFIGDRGAAAFEARVRGTWMNAVIWLFAAGAMAAALISAMEIGYRVTIDPDGDRLIVTTLRVRRRYRLSWPLSKMTDWAIESVEDSDHFDLVATCEGEKVSLLRASHGQCERVRRAVGR